MSLGLIVTSGGADGRARHDTSAEALPNNVTERKVVAIYKFDRETGEVTTTVQEKSQMYLRDLLGTLPGDRITVASITENQLAFAAAEGLNSLLDNLAERTFDQAGSYLVQGLDSFIGSDDGESVEVITNAGRAYIQGYGLQKDLPTTTLVPKSVATKAVRGEQKTYSVGNRRYTVNSTPLKATRQVEAIVAIVSNITRGSVGGGEDLLQPNPVVDILEVARAPPSIRRAWTGGSPATTWTGSAQDKSPPSAPPTPCAGPIRARWSEAATTWTAAGSTNPRIPSRQSTSTW